MMKYNYPLLLALLGLAVSGSAASAAAAALDISGCYRQDGSGNGFDKPVGGHKGHVYLQQHNRTVAGGTTLVSGCIQQYCFSALDGDLTVTENGAGMLRLTRSDGNCTVYSPANQSSISALAYFLVIYPRGWRGEPTTGSFVNNWGSHKKSEEIGHAGWLSLNKTTDEECRFMAHQGCMGPPPVEAVETASGGR